MFRLKKARDKQERLEEVLKKDIVLSVTVSLKNPSAGFKKHERGRERPEGDDYRSVFR